MFLFHWKEESQHAILDELEWTRCDRSLSRPSATRRWTTSSRWSAAVDGLLQAQARADVRYFCHVAESRFTGAEVQELETGVLRAYRWQYIVSGAQHPRFMKLLTGMITPAQAERITQALGPIMA